MKTRDFLFGMLACAAFSACSSDDVVDNGKEFTGGDSYVSIRLVATNADLNTRGSAGTGDDEFEVGTSDEATVVNSHFYFYDEKGDFLTEGETVSSIADSYPNQTGGNEETKGTVNIVLKNITKLPSSVLVVLNMDPTDSDTKFKKKLEDSYAALAKNELAYSYTVTTSGVQKTYFTMTNSTYMDGSNVVCATPVTTNHLQKSEEMAMKNPITIHVERMAAKVNVVKGTGFVAGATANVQTGDPVFL